MNQPRHTPAEAVQYWYDAATERREERDRLRAVIARIRQMADYWEQHLPEVIRTPAVVSALRAAMESASAVVSPPTDRAAAPTDWVDGHPQLEAIAAGVWEQCEHHESGLIIDDPRNIAVAAFGAALASQTAPKADSKPTSRAALRDRIVAEVQRLHDTGAVYALDAGEPERIADAVLAVLPEPTSRAAVLLDAADIAEDVALRLRGECLLDQVTGAYEVMTELRRLAGEAHDTGTQQPELQPARGDQFEAWLKTQYVRHVRLKDYAICDALHTVLSLYGLYADAAAQQEPAPVAQQPAAVPQRAYPDCERCGDTGIDPEQDGAPCPACQQSAAEVRHTGGNAEDCPACIEGGLNTLGYPWECPGPEQQPAP